jgi:hypothetical protein
MSEARKYHLNLIVANQFTTQLTQEIRDAVFGNMGTIVSFRIGQNDVESLSKYFQPTFDGDDLLRVPNHNTIVRTLIGGVPTQPFSMNTLPPLGNPNPRLAEALKQLSAAKYGKPKAVVTKEIMDRMATKEQPRPTGGFGAPSPSPFAGASGANQFGGAPASMGAQQQPRPAAPVSGGSFLDDWLSKRRTTPAAAAPASNGFGSNGGAQPAIATPQPQPQLQPQMQPNTAVQAAPANTPKPTETKNISSEEIERNEVDKIAAELKQQLNSSKDKTQAGQSPKGEHEVELKPGKDDTIYIDNEGTLHLANEPDNK